MSSQPKEFGKRCGLCFKYRDAHTYPFKINGKYLRLCRECWDKQAP